MSLYYQIFIKRIEFSRICMSTEQELVLTADCEICGASIEFDSNVVLNELIECQDCATEYEVISLTPLAIEEAPMEGEDWGQ